ncbi:MAG TPA: hypothetical protein VFV38_20425 [Ktedonobacteraceae bacterium]|nr:hypothetical protein [Ktedonobacteraceae bacterium]
MPQDETAEVKELRKKMREGRAPLLQAIREAYPSYLLARKGLERKNGEVREQLGLLNATFSGSIKSLRESAKNTDDSGEGVLLLYGEMSKQAKEVAAFIDKELPGLQKLFKPVSEKYAAYAGALEAYNQYMQQFAGKLPESDLSGRALELVKQEIEKSLR